MKEIALALTLASLVLNSAYATDASLKTAKGMSPTLTCPVAAPEGADAAMAAAMAKRSLRPGARDGAWLKSLFQRQGTPLTIPAGTDKAIALRTASLMKNGYIIGALMSEKMESNGAAYAKTSFSKATTAFIASSTMPVQDSEEGDESLKNASEGLTIVVGRMAKARKLAGPLAGVPSINFYLLGHAFDDPVAIEVASAMVCADKKNERDMKTISSAAAVAKMR